MAGFGKSIRDAVRKLSYNTSVDQLKKRGVNRVNVMGMDRMASLIEEAVQRSLRNKLLSLDREEVAAATKDEFMRLLRSNEELEKEQSELRRLKDQAEQEVDRLRRDLAEQERQLEAKLKLAETEVQASYAGEDQDIAKRLNTLLTGLSQAKGQKDIHEKVLAMVMDIVRGQRREALKAKESARDQEVQHLQRRIEKLSTSLETTEQQLVKITAVRDIDDGISSVYREVQGLSKDDRQYTHKKALMSNIFAANKELQTGMRTQRSESSSA